MTQRFKYQGNNEYGLDVYRDTYNDITYVKIPHTYVGHGSGTLERANNKAISADAEVWTELCLNDMYDVFGTVIVAHVDHYTDSDWDQLADLVSDLYDYSIYNETLFYEVELESQLEFIERELDYDDNVDPDVVLEAIHELGVLFEEEEGENWYISDDDFANAVDYAKTM